MSPRTGRPKAADPLTERVNIRLTVTEAQELDEYCQRNDTSRAEVAREGIRLVLGKEKEQNV